MKKLRGGKKMETN